MLPLQLLLLNVILIYIHAVNASAIIPTIPQAGVAEFEQILQQQQSQSSLALVEFFSPNCFHCQSYARSIEEAWQVWGQAMAAFADAQSPTLHWYQFSCAATADYCQVHLGLRVIPTIRL